MAKKFNPAAVAQNFTATTDEMKEKLTQVPTKQMIPLDLIDFHPHNDFRDLDDAEAVKDLAESIQAHGLYHDIYVYRKQDGSGRFLVISGEKRCKAYQYLHRTAINATVINEPLTDDEILLRLYEANLDTRPLSLNQRISYIQKLKDSLSDEGKKSFRTHIERLSKAFNVSERQVQKLVTVSESLIQRLVFQLTEKNSITINEAASYSTAPEIFQNAIADLLEYSESHNDEFDLKKAKEIIGIYLRKIKSNISLQKQSLTRINMRLKYAQEKLKSLNEQPDSGERNLQLKKWQNTQENCQIEISALQKKTDEKIQALCDEMKSLTPQSNPEDNAGLIKGIKVFSSFQRQLKKMDFLSDDDREKIESLLAEISAKYRL